MSKTVKVILIVLAVMVGCCLCIGVGAAVAGGSILQNAKTTEDPTEVAAITSGMADFDLPAGFDKPFGMNVFGFKMVGYISNVDQSGIMLMQFPAGLNLSADDMLNMFDKQSGKTSSGTRQTVTVETRPVTICGKDSVLSIQDSTSSDGNTVRVGAVPFSCKPDVSAILMVTTVPEGWNDSMVMNLIASFR